MKRQLFILMMILVFAGLLYNAFQISSRGPFNKKNTSNHPEPLLSNTPNTLKLGPEAAEDSFIPLNESEELDGKTRHEILLMRQKAVDSVAGLVDGPYVPYAPPFYQIVDKKPWYGIDGQFCFDRGMDSINGPSEETRFLLNPFILLGLDEDLPIITPGDPCDPLFPKVKELSWMPREQKARVTYDMKRFFNGRARYKGDFHVISFSCANYNARDFGYQYVFADMDQSTNLEEFPDSKIFDSPIPLRGYIHLGNSCRYPGGCNNGSPSETDLRFRVKSLPAKIYCKLWKNKPTTPQQQADFTYIVLFE